MIRISSNLQRRSIPAGRALQCAQERIVGVQYLRGLAAIFVMIAHAVGDVAAHGGSLLLPWYYVGAAGVDLFFIISGFIMVYASRNLFAAPGGWATFLRRRLARIVPLYWLATLLYVLLQVAREKWGGVDPAALVASLLFWPYPDRNATTLPIYSIGWTLNYEMIFYSIFVLGLPFRRSVGVALAATGLGVLTLIGLVADLPEPLAFWARPILIEFMLGMGVAEAYLGGWRLSRDAAGLCGLCGLLLLVFATWAGYNAEPSLPERFPRWLVWGGPFLLIFIAVVLRDGARNRGTRLPTLLGDASYAIYLLHPLVLIALRPALARFTSLCKGFPGDATCAALLYLVLAVAVVFASATAVHFGFERPITRFLGRANLPRRPEPPHLRGPFTGEGA